MEITSKGRYALRVMLHFAKENKFVSLAEVAEHEDISIKYLEKIVSMLGKAGLVFSHRGVSGGYKLAKSPSEISVFDILLATDNETKLASCALGEACPRAQGCSTGGFWNALTLYINKYLKEVSLQDIFDKNYKV